MILIVGPRSTFGFLIDLYVFFFYVIARFLNDFNSRPLLDLWFSYGFHMDLYDFEWFRKVFE